MAVPRVGPETKASVSLSGPISGTTRRPRVSTPYAASGIVGKPAGARGVLVLNGYGRAHRARTRDVTSKPNQVWVGDDSVVNVDGEIVGWIATAPLRDEYEIPRAVIERPRLRGTGRGGETSRDRRGDQKLPHRSILTIQNGYRHIVTMTPVLV